MNLYYAFLLILTASFLFLFNYLLLTIIYSVKKILQPVSDDKKLPKVSILKPISNIEDEFEENIESFFQIDYPDFEIIFGMDTDKQECWKIIEEISVKFPQASTKIISTISKKILNPKITTLMNMENVCQGELYWLTDANVRVEKDTLKRLVNEYILHDAKIVFSPIKGMGSKTIGSIIENAYINLFVSGNIISAWKFLKWQVIVGKSILIERYTLNQFGGFEYFRPYLAEDYMMGEIYTDNNIHVTTNYTWVTNVICSTSVMKCWSRIVRWGQMRYNIKPFHYIFEIITNPIAISLIYFIFTFKNAINIFLISVTLKIIIEYISFFAVNVRDRKVFWIILVYPYCILLKDILLFFAYIIPFFSKEVAWRGNKLIIGSKSRINPIKV